MKKKKTRRRALEPTCQGDASETAFRDATGRLADWSARRFLRGREQVVRRCRGRSGGRRLQSSVVLQRSQ